MEVSLDWGHVWEFRRGGKLTWEFDWSFKNVLITCSLYGVGSYLLENFKSSWACLRHLRFLLAIETLSLILVVLEEDFIGIVIVVDLLKSAVLMSEEAPFTIRTEQFLNESGAGLWLIFGISWKILGDKLVVTMCELALGWVSADTYLNPVLAELSLVLGPVSLLSRCKAVLLWAVLLQLTVGEVLLILGIHFKLIVASLGCHLRLVTVVKWLRVNNRRDLGVKRLNRLRLPIDKGNVEVTVLQLRGMREVKLLRLHQKLVVHPWSIHIGDLSKWLPLFVNKASGGLSAHPWGLIC